MPDPPATGCPAPFLLLRLPWPGTALRQHERRLGCCGACLDAFAISAPAAEAPAAPALRDEGAREGLGLGLEHLKYKFSVYNSVQIAESR